MKQPFGKELLVTGHVLAVVSWKPMAAAALSHSEMDVMRVQAP